MFIKYRVKLLLLKNLFIFTKNYSLSYYFSRFANNLQQIAIGILYAEKIKGNFYSPPHPLINSFSVINSNFFKKFSLVKKHYRFFYFTKPNDFPDGVVTEIYIESNIQRVFQDSIKKEIPFLEERPPKDNELIFHIRSGDIFTNFKNDYFQNPINFYDKIIDKFEKTIVVTSEEMNNPIIQYLKTISKVEFHSSTIKEDFNILYNAVNLATSGVGTFPIAAALMSNNLKNIYYSNLFLKEHLNPKMILSDRITHHKFYVSDEYKLQYQDEKNINQLILDSNIKVDSDPIY